MIHLKVLYYQMFILIIICICFLVENLLTGRGNGELFKSCWRRPGGASSGVAAGGAVGAAVGGPEEL